MARRPPPREARQPRLAGLDEPQRTPPGYVYRAEFLSVAEEAHLADILPGLPLQHFEFRGFYGKRRVVSYGWRYSFGDRALHRADPIPGFLQPLRERAAAFAGLSPESLEQSSVIEYAAGTTIGWHRDKAVFADVIGISLLSPCVLRMRRKDGDGWQRWSRTLEPRSAYVMRGEARQIWEHSIPPVRGLRFSVTFRSMADLRQAPPRR